MVLSQVTRRRAVLAILCAFSALGAVPTPKDHFGFTPGDDYKLANYQEVISYFQKLAAASDRIKLVEFGKSSEGRATYVAFISSAENLKKLDQYKEMNRRLALGLATPEEAARLSAESKAIVWIDSGLHATEVAPVQQAPHLAYRMITGETEEIRRIRDNVILMQVPVINPDGLDMTAGWYRKNVGTPHELAPLPTLYQKYSGHDNNRDWFMLNLPETRNVCRLLFREWFPQIVYNQHQVAPFPARIFIPPYAEPLNPNIPAAVMEGINGIGAAMRERFARENKAGAISYNGFDAWWNGGLRSAPAFHNMHGILTETALYQYATPKEYKLSEIPERFANGIPAREPSVFYEKPWLGGRWALMDAVDYMLTADFAILELAASRPRQFLHKAWEMAQAQIEAGQKGGPYAYVIPADAGNAWQAAEMLRRLQGAGVEVRKTTAAVEVGGKSYPSGSYLVLTAQPFRGYIVDLMEPQKYPEIRSSANGPVKRPYDLAGWTLPYQMGVQYARIEQPAAIGSELIGDLPAQEPPASWLPKPGAPKARVAVYEPFLPNSDSGWTQWTLDYFHVGHTVVHNADLRAADLRSRFDTIILAQQTMNSILHGTREGERSGRGEPQGEAAHNVQRPEFTGGIGVEGVRSLQEFVKQGGTLVALDSATELPLALFPIGVRGVLRGGEEESAGGWSCPGSLLHLNVDTAHPLAQGVAKDAIATSTGGQAFDITMLPEFNQGDREVKVVASYAKTNLLASGWIAGERIVAGKPAVISARMGQGRVVLIGFRAQFRGQSFGTFKFLLNAIYQSAGQN
ncbi:M14 family zinc carboxypeptidase [Paludibaculum fermentans]|uniref:M14 family metallopeptidase n=1 Tax=Paludibaculum fermentans TaxID=1473598 RepID=UPI003EBEB78F